MSEVRLVIREAGQDWSGTVHGSDADRVIAALSADPVSLAETIDDVSSLRPDLAPKCEALVRDVRNLLAGFSSGFGDTGFDTDLHF